MNKQLLVMNRCLKILVVGLMLKNISCWANKLPFETTYIVMDWTKFPQLLVNPT